jgi:hypothetical protein
MKFWDASAVIPLFLEEPETPRMLEIARLRREAILTTSQEDRAIGPVCWTCWPKPGRRSGRAR